MTEPVNLKQVREMAYKLVRTPTQSEYWSGGALLYQAANEIAELRDTCMQHKLAAKQDTPRQLDFDNPTELGKLENLCKLLLDEVNKLKDAVAAAASLNRETKYRVDLQEVTVDALNSTVGRLANMP